MRGLSLVALLLAGFTSAARAQSQQRWSVQGSGALVFPTADESDFENSTRLGWEAQVRYTFSRFSLGGGYQTLDGVPVRATRAISPPAVSVFFLEPRYVLLAGSRAAVYLAGRIGMQQARPAIRRRAAPSRASHFASRRRRRRADAARQQGVARHRLAVFHDAVRHRRPGQTPAPPGTSSPDWASPSDSDRPSMRFRARLRFLAALVGRRLFLRAHGGRRYPRRVADRRAAARRHHHRRRDPAVQRDARRPRAASPCRIARSPGPARTWASRRCPRAGSSPGSRWARPRSPRTSMASPPT